MTMHRTLVDLVDSRIVSALKENEISLSKDKVDVLVIGHGSMDPNAGISINYIVDELRKSYHRARASELICRAVCITVRSEINSKYFSSL